ncbi:MAG: KGK domain-containing protein [Lyngbya sp.]|nr:KGK domain-containing protein [Lyngbya sp.]
MSQFELLNDDTAILMINRDTFTVARLKQLIEQKFSRKFSHRIENTGFTLQSYFGQGLVIIEEQNVRISMSDFQITFPTEGMECQLLDFNTKQWKTGKLKIFIDVKLGSNGREEIKLEFAPDEPPLSDIDKSLDELRKQNLES